MDIIFENKSLQHDWKTVLKNPHFKKMPEVLVQTLGTDEGNEILIEIENTTKLLFEIEAAVGETDPDELFGYILPSIAAYMTMRKTLGCEKALSIFRSFYLSAAYTGAEKLRKMAENPEFLSQFPHQMAGNKSTCPTESGGFVFQLIRDDSTGSEFHVLKCPYNDYCKKYQCEELVTTFCDCDDICYDHIHSTLKWNRSETIGRGGALCDFRFDWG